MTTLEPIFDEVRKDYEDARAQRKAAEITSLANISRANLVIKIKELSAGLGRSMPQGVSTRAKKDLLLKIALDLIDASFDEPIFRNRS